MFRFFSFLLTAVNVNFDYLFAAMVYFLCFPVIKGIYNFNSSFLLTGKINLYIIFKSYYNAQAFVESLEHSLLCLIMLGFLIFPFALTAALPYIFYTEDRITIVFEVASLFLLVFGSLLWLSFLSGKKLKREYAYFYLSFLIHYAIAYFTKGLYLLFLFPYISISFIYFKEKPQ
ncbi:MAG: hypothetical protein PHW77_06600 [Eubacteriales bacterium]|nr:hypothetical protein [Eubacteriales bacterium]